jgi:hypothetical protein
MKINYYPYILLVIADFLSLEVAVRKKYNLVRRIHLLNTMAEMQTIQPAVWIRHLMGDIY